MKAVIWLIILAVFLAACTQDAVQPVVEDTIGVEEAEEVTDEHDDEHADDEHDEETPELTLPETEQNDTVEEPQNTTIHIVDLQYEPDTLTVKVGTTVTWKNVDHYLDRDINPHIIIAKGNAFRSSRLNYGDEFSFTFTEPGTYEYFDPWYTDEDREIEDDETLSDGEDLIMIGTIVVE